MLHRALILVLISTLVLRIEAQVVVNTPLLLVGPDSTRHISGTSSPLTLTSAITVDAAALGSAHWSASSLNGDTILLQVIPEEPGDRIGLLLRAVTPSGIVRPAFAQVGDGSPLPLLNRDGTAAGPKDLPAGKIMEIITAGSAHHLQGSGVATCPEGTVQVNSAYCIDRSPGPSLSFYAAARHCAVNGGRLCAWDEYIAACELQGTVIIGLFDDWEWINDTSNHTHTADQAGRTTCLSQRSAGPVAPVSTRCCYRAR